MKEMTLEGGGGFKPGEVIGAWWNNKIELGAALYICRVMCWYNSFISNFLDCQNKTVNNE
jgi:hypothetical protein